MRVREKLSNHESNVVTSHKPEKSQSVGRAEVGPAGCRASQATGESWLLCFVQLTLDMVSV